MLEILLSLMLTGMVMLGIFASHLQQTQKAVILKQYTLASNGLRNIAEKMLANPQGVEEGHYNAGYKASVKDCLSLNCNPDELAAYDINATVNEMREYLSAFKLEIAPAASPLYELTASWQGVSKTQTTHLQFDPLP